MILISDHVWYLPNHIDMVTCPKNGMTSFKSFYHTAYRKAENRRLEHEKFEYAKGGPLHRRDQRIWNMSSFHDYPFRSGSTRFAVKRDPVKRFVSAVEFLQRRGRLQEPRCDRDYTHYEKVSDVLDGLENNRIFEFHLLPQTYFMGDRCKYDHIYDIVDLSSMFKAMTKKMGLQWSSALNVKANTMKTPVEKRITNDLSFTDIERIKSLYQIDYANGWY